MTINTEFSSNHITFQQKVVHAALPKNTIEKLNQSHCSKSLVLWSEELQYLPNILTYCHDIQELTLIGDFEFLPDTISDCPNLRELSIRSNKLLKHIPVAISQCRELKVLNIHETLLESLPNALAIVIICRNYLLRRVN